jgi:hypothetical protein
LFSPQAYKKRELEIDSDTTLEVKKARKKMWLPPGAETDNRFRAIFIPTYERWVGTQANPWVIPDTVAITILQAIWDAIYPDVPWTVKPNDCVFERVGFSLFF